MKEQPITIEEQFAALGWKGSEKEKFPSLTFNTESAENKYKRLKVAASVGKLDMDWLKITSNRIQAMITSKDATEVELEDAGSLMFALEEAASVVRPKTLRDKRDMRRLLISRNFQAKGYYSNPKRKPFYFNDYDPIPEGKLVADFALGVSWSSLSLSYLGAWAAGGMLLEPTFGSEAIKGAYAGAYLSFIPAFCWLSFPSLAFEEYVRKTKFGRRVLWGGNNSERR